MRSMALLVVSLVLNVPVLLTNILQYLTTATDTDSLMFSSYLGKLCFIMLNIVRRVRRFSSFIYRNSFVVCQNFGWLVEDFSEGNVNLCNSFSILVTEMLYPQILCALLLHGLISSRERYLFLDSSFLLTRSELQCVMDYVSCACCLLFLLFLCTLCTICIINM